MIRAGRSRVAAMVVCGALLAACSGGEPDVEATAPPIGTTVTETEPTAGPTPTSTPTEATSDVDVTVIPDEITPAYVDAVANTLYGIIGEVTAELLAQPADPANNLTRDQLDRVADVSDREEYTARIEELRSVAQDEAAREGLLPADQFEGLGFETVSLLVGDESCIVAVGYLNRDGTTVGGGLGDDLVALSLSPKRGTEQANTTPWLAVDQVPNRGPDGEPNPDEVMLEATLDDFGDVLIHSCGGEG